MRGRGAYLAGHAGYAVAASIRLIGERVMPAFA